MKEYSQVTALDKLHAADLRQKIQVNQQLREEERKKEARENAGFFERAGVTLLDIFTELGGGLAKGLEGVVDAGASFVGLFGADVDGFIARDLTQELWYSWEDALTDYSYLNDVPEIKSFVRNVGQQLPSIIAIAAAPFTGGASLAALPYTTAATVVSAGGQGAEHALNEGAEFNEALGYGVSQMGIEFVLEAATMGLGKGITSIGKSMGKGASKTMGKTVIEEFIQEGVEEFATAMTDPLAKKLTYDEDALEAYKDVAFYQNALEQAVIGAFVGGTVASTGYLANRRMAGGTANLSISESINEVSTLEKKEANLWKNDKFDEATQKQLEYQKQVELDNISKQLQTMNDEERATTIKKFGLESRFNQDGSIKSLANELTQEGTKRFIPSNAGNIKAFSPNLRGQEVLLMPTNNTLSQPANDAKKFISMLNPNAKIVITDDMYENADAFYDSTSKVFYISNKISGEKISSKIAGHEVAHSLEGTKEYEKLANYLLSKVENLEAKIQQKVEQYKNVNTRLKEGEAGGKVALYEAQTEIIADEMGRLLSDTKAIERVINENKSLALKIWQWIKDVIAKLTKRGNNRTYYEYIRNAEKLYANAIKASIGGVSLTQVRETQDFIAEFERLVAEEEAAALDNGEDVRYSKSQYKQYTTLAKQWAFNTSTQNGDTKILYNAQNNTWNKLVADRTRDEGYQVIESIEDIPINEGKIKNLIRGDEYDNINEKRESFNRYIEDYESEQSGYPPHNGYSVYQDRGKDGRISGIHKTQSTSNARGNKNQSNGDNRYSLSQSTETDSNGTPLSPAQSRFFKDSKVRDAKGNLLVVYHGSKATPTEFKKEYISKWNMYGDGYYFTDNHERAKGYAQKSLLTTYLNITNPFYGQNSKHIELLSARLNLNYDDIRKYAEEEGLDGGDLFVLAYYADEQDINLAQEIQSLGFDGIIDKGFNGYEYVVYNSNQIKETTNINPTISEDIRFAINKNKDIKDLVVIHNTTATKLLKSINLGGLVVPSVAITKTDNNFDNFGEISLIFRTDTIDPQDKRNKVYASDIYSRRFPKTINKFAKDADEKLAKRFEESAKILDIKIKNLDLYLEEGNISTIADGLKNKEYVRLQYLLDNGVDFEPIYKEFTLNDMDKKICDMLISKFPAEVKDSSLRESDFLIDKVVPEIKRVKKEHLLSKGFKGLANSAAENTGLYDADNYLEKAEEYLGKKGQKVLDETATNSKIRELVKGKEQKVYSYVSNILEQYNEGEYYRTNLDYYDKKGFPRSFNQLYKEVNLQNILDYMTQGDMRDSEGFDYGVGNLRSLLSKQYNSIEEIKKNKDKIVSAEKIAELQEISRELHYNLSASIDEDAGNDILKEIAKTNRSDASIIKIFKENYLDAPSHQLIRNIQDFLNNLEDYPTGYFEAKPQRVVSFDEVVKVFAPKNVDKEIIQFFKDKKINIQLYDESTNRAELLKTLPDDIRFSLKDGQGNYNYSKGQIAKYVASHSKLKSYSKTDAEKIINTIVAEKLNFGERYGELKGKTKEEVVLKLWHALNTANEGYRAGVALDIADFVIENSIVNDMFESAENEGHFYTIDMLSPYLHSIDLTGIKEEIKNHYDKDNSPYAIWGKRKDTKGTTPDQIAQELEEQGYYFESNNPADIFFEIDSRYREAIKGIKTKSKQKIADIASAEETKKLRQVISSEILASFDKAGQKTAFAKSIEKYTTKIGNLKRAVKDIKQNNKAKNNLISTIERMRDEFVKSRPAGWKVPDQVVNFVKKISKVETWRNDISSRAREYIKDIAVGIDLVLDDQQKVIYPYHEVLQEMAMSQDEELSTQEYVMLDQIFRQMMWQLKNYDKVYFEGKQQSITELAEQGVHETKQAAEILPDGNKVFTKFIHKIYSNPYDRLDEVALHRGNSIFRRIYAEMLDGDRRRAGLIQEVNLLFDDFFKHNKDYAKSLQKQIKIGKNDIMISKRQALSIYCTSLREQGRTHLFNQEYDKGVVRILDSDLALQGKMKEAFKQGKDIVITQDDIDDIKRNLTEADKQYLELVDKFFNVVSKDAKTKTDKALFGVTNVEDGYYFPLKVSDDKIYTQAGQNYDTNQYILDLGMNKSVKPKASNKLVIDGIDSILANHLEGLSLYYGFAQPLTAYNRIMNKQVSTPDETDHSTNIRGAIRGFDTHFEDYMNKLWQDVQGIRNKNDLLSNTMSYFRWAGSTSALGLNPKILFTQSLSLASAMSEFDFKYIAKGMMHFFGEKHKKDLAKYSSLMWERQQVGHNVDIVEMREVGKGVGGNIVSKGAKQIVKVTNTITTKPIAWMDSNAIQALWFSSQYEIADKMGVGYEVGTEANKILAGKRLDEVVFRTQQTNSALGRSEWLRSQNELVKFWRMFTSDVMQLVGRFVASYRKQRNIKKMLKSKDPELRELGEKLRKEGNKGFAKASSAIVTNTMAYIAIALAFKWLKGDIEDDEWEEKVKKEFTASLLGFFPMGGDISNLLLGYQPSNMAYSAMSDMVEIAQDLMGMAESLITDEVQTETQLRATGRKMLINLARLFGIPLKNLESYTVGIVGKISPATREEYDALFNIKTNKVYLDKIKKATERGDEKTANTIINIMFSSRTGAIKNDKVLSKVRDLIEQGYDVLPKSVSTTITYDDVDYKLTKRQYNNFMKIYAESNNKVQVLINNSNFRMLDNEAQAKAIKFVYDYYYSMALEDLIGEDFDEKKFLFGTAVPVEVLAMAVAQAAVISADKNSAGNAISGTKKAKIQRFIQSMRLTAAQKYMLMGYLGYSNVNGENQVRSYINTLHELSRNQKLQLLKLSGYAA